MNYDRTEPPLLTTKWHTNARITSLLQIFSAEQNSYVTGANGNLEFTRQHSRTQTAKKLS